MSSAIDLRASWLKLTSGGKWESLIFIYIKVLSFFDIVYMLLIMYSSSGFIWLAKIYFIFKILSLLYIYCLAKRAKKTPTGFNLAKR